MDGVQLGHYLDNVFAFRAGLDLKIGLGGMAAEAGILHGLRQAWGLWKENVRGAARDGQSMLAKLSFLSQLLLVSLTIS